MAMTTDSQMLMAYKSHRHQPLTLDETSQKNILKNLASQALKYLYSSKIWHLIIKRSKHIQPKSKNYSNDSFYRHCYFSALDGSRF
jgi:hypothetical protein